MFKVDSILTILGVFFISWAFFRYEVSFFFSMIKYHYHTFLSIACLFLCTFIYLCSLGIIIYGV